MAKSVLTRAFPGLVLAKSKSVLRPYGNGPVIRPCGHVELLCERNNQYYTLKFQVLPDEAMCGKPALLSAADCVKMDILQIKADEVHQMTSDNQNSQDQSRQNVLPPAGSFTKDTVRSAYSDVFEGLGKLDPPVSFQVNPEVKPVQMPIYRRPVAKRNKEKETLDRYESLGILKRVEAPTPWCSNPIIIETPTKFRICLEPSQTINKTIERPVFQMPTITEHLHRLGRARCFSVLDAKDGFLQCPLDEASSLMTNMHTSFGRYRWLRMPFGVNSAPEEFQMRIAAALDGIEGIISIADDILIYGDGETDEEAEISHDRHLTILLDRCAQRSLKLNPRKFRFRQKEVKFMGHIFTPRGITIDPERVRAISEIPVPKDKKAVQRFLGTMNHLTMFCPDLGNCLEPLRRLLRDDVDFTWGPEQTSAFSKAKDLVTSAPVLMYFDPTLPVTLQVDASDYGLGGALLQPNKDDEYQPVAFTSSTLSRAERNYSQIEKECLAIVHTMDHFDHWLFGKDRVTVHTDHQPLETIFKKPLSKAPSRLQRMMMKLQRYMFVVSYRPGKSLWIADTLSRAPLPRPVSLGLDQCSVFRTDLELEGQNPLFKEITTIMLREATATDPLLQMLMQVIIKGFPVLRSELPSDLQPFWNFRDELTVIDGTIYQAHPCFISFRDAT